MGLLGDLALGLAGLALEALTSDDDSSSGTKSASTRPYAVLFETNWPYSATDVRNSFLQALIVKTGGILGIEISGNRYVYWDVNMDEAADGEFISDFVITDGNTTICYGMFGMAQCALSISGEDAQSVAEQLQSTLKEMDCWRAEITREEIPFHNKDWMESTIDSLYHSDSDSEEEDDDEEEENDLADETLMLISAFLGGDGSKVSDDDVKLVASELESWFKRDFDAKKVKSQMSEYIEEFKKSSYKMFTENIVDEYDDDTVFGQLYCKIFIFAYGLITVAGRFSKFSAEFIIKTKQILKINDDTMTEIIEVISGLDATISEHDLQKFYEQMKFCANDSTAVKEKQLIAHNYKGRRVMVQYTSRRDEKTIDFLTNTLAPYISLETGDFKVTSENLEELIEELKDAAEDGISFAQFGLGNRYFYGNGVEKDIDKAFEFMTLAAEQDDFQAYFPLGVCYEKGFGTEVDEEKAVELYKKASDAGDAEAQKRLGYLYANGTLVSKNSKKAFLYYSLAAGQWDAEAMYQLGVLYYEGKGCTKNEKQGLSLIKLAAKENVPNASEYLEKIKEEKAKSKAASNKAAAQKAIAAKPSAQKASPQTKAVEKKSQTLQNPQKPKTAEEKAAPTRQNDERISQEPDAALPPPAPQTKENPTQETQTQATTVAQKTESDSAWLLKIPLEEIEEKYTAERKSGESRISPFTAKLHLAKEKPAKVKGAKSYAKLSDGETPILVYDDTVFGGAKDGFLLTDKAVYVHKAFENGSQKIPLEKVYSFELKLGIFGGAGDMLLNGSSMAVTTVAGDERKKLLLGKTAS